MDRTGSVEPSDKVLCKQKFIASAFGLGPRLVHLTTEAYSVLICFNCKNLFNAKLVFITTTILAINVLTTKVYLTIF